MCVSVCLSVCACVIIVFSCICLYVPAHIFLNSNTRSRGSTDESLDEDEDNLLEVDDVTAYLRFNKEVCTYVHCFYSLIPMTTTHST